MIITTKDFSVELEKGENDLYTLSFSEGDGPFSPKLPSCITGRLEQSTSRSDEDKFNTAGWNAHLEYSGMLQMYMIDLNEDISVPFWQVNRLRFWAITKDNKVLLARRVHKNCYNHLSQSSPFSIKEYTDSVVIVRDDFGASWFFDKNGNLLLSTEGMPVNREYGSSMLDPHNLIITPHFILAKENHQWSIYSKTIKQIRTISELSDYNLSGFCDGNYIILHSDESSFVLYKDGDIIYSGHRLGGVWKYNNDDIYYVYGHGGSPFFHNKEYLYNIVISHGSDILNADDLLVFYHATDDKRLYGIINRKLEIVLPPILEYAEIVLGSYIKYSRDGKYGVWDKSFKTIIPAEYSEINVIASFFIAVKKGSYYEDCFYDQWSHHFYYPLDWTARAKKQGPSEGFQIINKEGDISLGRDFDHIYLHNPDYMPPDYMPNIRTNREETDSIDTNAVCLCVTQKDNVVKFGVVRNDGTFVIQPNYSLIVPVTVEDNKQTFIVAFTYAEGMDMIWEEEQDGNGWRGHYEFKGGKYGLLSTSGRVIIPALYDAVVVFSDYVRVRIGNKFGLFTIDGRVLLDTVFSAISIVDFGDGEHVAFYNINGHFNKEFSAEVEYENHFLYLGPDVKTFDHRLDHKTLSIEGGLWGYYNIHKDIRGDAIYAEIHPFERGKAIVKNSNGYYYLINKEFDIEDGPYNSWKEACSKTHIYDEPVHDWDDSDDNWWR